MFSIISKGDNGNPFQDGADSKFTPFINVTALFFMAVVFFKVFKNTLIGDEREKALGTSMSRSQRQLLKDFIMRKEAEVLGDNNWQPETPDILEAGAVDCLYGLHALFQKLLSSEWESKKNWSLSTVSSAGWLQAIQCKHKQMMDPEETKIAQILFDAADLDESHTITFTEFAMLAVLLSATDSNDADAQV